MGRESAQERLENNSMSALPSDCMIWMRRTDVGGYGRMSYLGVERPAHRVAYELKYGPVPEGMIMDHLCRVRGCVNPDHVEPVTNRENTIRGVAAEVNGERMKSITHCPSGHPYSSDNTYIRPNGWRTCRTCHREQERERRAKIRKEGDSLGA